MRSKMSAYSSGRNCGSGFATGTVVPGTVGAGWAVPAVARGRMARRRRQARITAGRWSRTPPAAQRRAEARTSERSLCWVCCSSRLSGIRLSRRALSANTADAVGSERPVWRSADSRRMRSAAQERVDETLPPKRGRQRDFVALAQRVHLGLALRERPGCRVQRPPRTGGSRPCIRDRSRPAWHRAARPGDRANRASAGACLRTGGRTRR